MKITIQDVERGIGLVERLAGSGLAKMLLDAAVARWGGEWSAEDKASLDANYADGLARRADAAARASQ